MLILKLPSASDALKLPLDILSNCKPTTALAEIFVNPEPSPINEPVKNEPVIEPLTIKLPVISVSELIDTLVPVSVILLSFKCSIPVPFGILFSVK